MPSGSGGHSAAIAASGSQSRSRRTASRRPTRAAAWSRPRRARRAVTARAPPRAAARRSCDAGADRRAPLRSRATPRTGGGARSWSPASSPRSRRRRRDDRGEPIEHARACVRACHADRGTLALGSASASRRRSTSSRLRRSIWRRSSRPATWTSSCVRRAATARRPLIEAGARRRGRGELGWRRPLRRPRAPEATRLELGRARVLGRNRLRERLMMGVEPSCASVSTSRWAACTRASPSAAALRRASFSSSSRSISSRSRTARLDGERARGDS